MKSLDEKTAVSSPLAKAPPKAIGAGDVSGRAADGRSPFLEGSFAPVVGEVTVFNLPITGLVPPELNGCYLRNGPNTFDRNDSNHHWFLGDGMVHGVRLRGGRAEWYRNRWVRSKAVAERLGCKWVAGPVYDHDFAANTHVIAHAGRILAMVEGGPLPYQLSPELDTMGTHDFQGTLPGSFVAHPKLDPRTGELHAVTYSHGLDYVQHIVVDAGGRVTRVTNIAVTDRPMMHDFALTEKYVVLLDLPVTFNADAAAAGRRVPFTWNPAHQARIGLLPRDGGSDAVRWFEVEPCWVFHTLNAYDDEHGRVVVDVCRYASGFDVSALGGQGSGTLHRWTVDPRAGKVIESRLDDRAQEFPRVDERFVSRPHRYGYTAVTAEFIRASARYPGDSANDVRSDSLLKHDLVRGTVDEHTFGPGAATSEPVFAPRHPDGAEDEGYVLSFVHDPDRGAADLVILAAEDFGGQPVARVHLPTRVPIGLHGSWLADA
jgi:carotenoid cleavage dioxygenase